MNDPLPDAQRMQCLHRYMSWHLFRIGGQPRVLKRWIEKRKDAGGKITPTLREEWGGLDGNHMTDNARAAMRAAWSEWDAWSKDNA